MVKSCYGTFTRSKMVLSPFLPPLEALWISPEWGWSSGGCTCLCRCPSGKTFVHKRRDSKSSKTQITGDCETTHHSKPRLFLCCRWRRRRPPSLEDNTVFTWTATPGGPMGVLHRHTAAALSANHISPLLLLLNISHTYKKHYDIVSPVAYFSQ